MHDQVKKTINFYTIKASQVEYVLETATGEELIELAKDAKIALTFLALTDGMIQAKIIFLKRKIANFRVNPTDIFGSIDQLNYDAQQLLAMEKQAFALKDEACDIVNKLGWVGEVTAFRFHLSSEVIIAGHIV